LKIVKVNYADRFAKFSPRQQTPRDVAATSRLGGVVIGTIIDLSTPPDVRARARARGGFSGPVLRGRAVRP
jgi:hypothetical protein